MSEFKFIEQMEENVKFNLIFPFHIDFKQLIGNSTYNKKYPGNYHHHSFEEVLRAAYLEPKAFYLTEDDKKYYSFQELEFIYKVIEDEKMKLNKGYEIVSLDLDEETIAMINEYKIAQNLTFEEAIIDILEKIVKYPKILEGVENNE